MRSILLSVSLLALSIYLLSLGIIYIWHTLTGREIASKIYFGRTYSFLCGTLSIILAVRTFYMAFNMHVPLFLRYIFKIAEATVLIVIGGIYLFVILVALWQFLLKVFSNKNNG